MARSLIGGLIANRIEPHAITVADPSAEARQYVADNFGVEVDEANEAVIAASSSVVLAVKPQVMQSVLESLRTSLQASSPLLISIAAGVRLNEIDTWSGGGLAIVRVMPNTPALIKKGVSAMYGNCRVSDQQMSQVDALLKAVGKTVWLPNEDLLDAVTAVSGSGPAYFFYLIESIEQAAVKLGLAADTAHTLATETAVGAALLAATSNESPQVLRQRVTSPGGVTEAAIKVLEDTAVGDKFVDAIIAGERKSAQLSQPKIAD